ncbi:MAG: GNAT family N-acetyltransferase [Proteobacteria bacterium]|nr:GNAT family N-acetyltransferase [Pseudomonadota bacterium]
MTDLSHWTGAKVPDGRVLSGRTCRLERLDPARHGDDLWAAVQNHDQLWDYLGYGPFADGAVFRAWLDSRAPLSDPYAYVVIDSQSDRALGVATLMEIRPAMGVIEVGHIFFSPELQRTPAATEAIYLLARHAFEDLGYRRFEWKCNAANAPSRRAALRFGFVYEGTFRQHMIVKGKSRDTAWFSITDNEWPYIEQAFSRWLAPGNFDARGAQKIALSAINQREISVGSLVLTRMTGADRDAIEAFQEAAYARNRAILGAEPLPLKWDYGTIFLGTEVWGVHDKDALVGLLILRPGDDALRIESVATLPQVQGGGYGNAMLNAAEFRARDWGFAAIRLLTGEKLTQNVEWYLRKGFHVETLERLPDRSIVHMIKHLRD